LLVIKKIEYEFIYLLIHYSTTTELQQMSMTLELVAQRVEILEKQMALLMADKTTDSSKPDKKEKDKKDKKEKKEKKSSKSDSDDEPPKKKRVSGYILFGKAERDSVKAMLETTAEPDTKVKSTDVMKRLGELWKELSEDERLDWNAKAKELSDQP